MVDSKRLFVGVRVSVATANALARCAEALARRARDANVEIAWVRPENYHVTLKFLGWTHGEAVVAICDHIEAALVGMKPFSFQTSRLGGFPSLDSASVLWAGVESRDGSPLAEIAERIDRATTALGFPAENRPFHAHVTLGRVAIPVRTPAAGLPGVSKTRSLRDLVLPVSEQMFSKTEVDAVTLLESINKSGSYTYESRARISFKTAEIDLKRQREALDLADETDDGWSESAAREQAQ